jgi:hypothetical protein
LTNEQQDASERCDIKEHSGTTQQLRLQCAAYERTKCSATKVAQSTAALMLSHVATNKIVMHGSLRVVVVVGIHTSS